MIDIQKKHILVITSVYPRSLTDRYGCFLQEFILNLQPTGLKFTVFAPAFKGCQNQLLNGVKVYRFRYCPKKFEDLTHGEESKGARGSTKVQKNPLYLLVAALYIFLGSWQLFWVCYQEKPDLLHVHWPFPHGLMAFPASKLLNIPMIFSFYGAELSLIRKFPFVKSILRWLMPKSLGITAISSYTKDLAQKIYNCSITVIPYGLTIEAKPSKVRLPEELPKILCVGNMFERKGMKYLLEAMPLVLAKQPAQLRIVGKGEQEQALKAQCKALELDDNVKFLGFVSNETLAQEYASCDFFVLPSIVDSQGDTEGQGVPVIEALAHSKPVVGSAVGGIVDAIQSGETGLLVPEKDPQALAEAILTLLSNPEEAKEMGNRGLKDVQKRYSWSYLSKLWLNVFVKALDESK
jgi:glycosyltransferase involved in cell wall biosynthesis